MRPPTPPVRAGRAPAAARCALLAVALLAAACSRDRGPDVAQRPAPSTTAVAAAPPEPTAAAPSSTPPTAPTTTAAAAPALVWRSCATGECATLQVPLDHDVPDGPKLGIAVSRAKATDPAQRIGSLVLNPGGPGVAGVPYVPYFSRILSTAVRRRFDVVSFDPRGTGGSNQVRCLPAGRMAAYLGADPSPDSDAEEGAFVAVAAELARGCQQRMGDFLGHVGTIDVARDLDLLRAALGDERLSYVGYSYGTYLGAAYAELFPTRVRALVLDGPVDPAEDPIASARSQAIGFDRAFASFAEDCARRPSCRWRPAGGPSKAAAAALLDRVDSAPLAAEAGRPLQPGDAFAGIASALYDESSWPSLGAALADAERGRGAKLQDLSDEFTGRRDDGSYNGLFEALAAISCRDRQGTRDLAVIEAAAVEAATAAPLFGPGLVWSAVTCAVWPVPAQRGSEPFTAPGAPPILVVGTSGDPATPIENARALADQLSSGVLFTHTAEGHTSYGGSCVDGPADAYLIRLAVPADGAGC